MWLKTFSLPENRMEFLNVVDTRNAVCSVMVAAYLSACRTDTVLSLITESSYLQVFCMFGRCLNYILRVTQLSEAQW
jgi:hypothetical protein